MNSKLPEVMPRTPRPAWQRAVGPVLALAALAYLARLVLADFQSFAGALRGQTPVSLAVAIIAVILMFAVKAHYHGVLCQRLSKRKDLLADVIPAYAMAQVVRYLPGKIWGVVYQSNRLSMQLHPSVVVAANTSQTLVTNLLGAGIIVSVLGAAYTSSFWPLAGIPAFVAITEIVHRYPRMEAWLLQVASRNLRRRTDLPQIPPQRISGTLMLLLEWVAYYFMWAAILGEGLPSFPTVTVATWYAAASLIAIFAVAVPAGIAVREALFVSLAAMTMSSSGELLGYAALMRAVLTAAEVMLIPVAQLAGKLIGRFREQAA